jgi:hypothetical protein
MDFQNHLNKKITINNYNHILAVHNAESYEYWIEDIFKPLLNIADGFEDKFVIDKIIYRIRSLIYDFGITEAGISYACYRSIDKLLRLFYLPEENNLIKNMTQIDSQYQDQYNRNIMADLIKAITNKINFFFTNSDVCDTIYSVMIPRCLNNLKDLKIKVDLGTSYFDKDRYTEFMKKNGLEEDIDRSIKFLFSMLAGMDINLGFIETNIHFFDMELLMKNNSLSQYHETFKALKLVT